MTAIITGRARPTCAHSSLVSETGTRPGWVLVMCDPAGRARLIADDARPRRWAGLSRTQVAPTQNLVTHLGEAVRASTATGQPQASTTVLASGRRWRIFTVPITRLETGVVAVQAWGGLRSSAIPPRPPVGTAHWAPGHGGLAATSVELEQMLDTGNDGPATRALPDLVDRLDQIDDRENLLALFDPATSPTVWSGLAVTAARGGGERRSLWISARSDGVGPAREVSAAVVDVSTAHPPPAPELATRLVHGLPLPDRHGVGVVDLATGLVHQWLRPGPGALRRWVTEVPAVHPDDQVDLDKLRDQLCAGHRKVECRWRIRFGAGSGWLTVHGMWTLLPGPRPQAVLDVRMLRNRAGEKSRSRT